MIIGWLQAVVSGSMQCTSMCLMVWLFTASDSVVFERNGEETPWAWIQPSVSAVAVTAESYCFEHRQKSVSYQLHSSSVIKHSFIIIFFTSHHRHHHYHHCHMCICDRRCCPSCHSCCYFCQRLWDDPYVSLLFLSSSVGRISKKIVVDFHDIWRTDSLWGQFDQISLVISPNWCSLLTVLTSRAESMKEVQVTCHFVADWAVSECEQCGDRLIDWAWFYVCANTI